MAAPIAVLGIMDRRCGRSELSQSADVSVRLRLASIPPKIPIGR